MTIPAGSERLLAYVALCCRATVPRALVAGVLWPETEERCAYANLRSALSRLRRAAGSALEVDSAEVRLAREVSVDYDYARSLAQLILNGASEAHLDFGVETVHDLSVELLPGWYDEWALLEAEAWRQLRIHSLEKLASDFIAAARFAEAVAAAHAAICADPLLESSQASLIRAHLAEGNRSAALRDFKRYERRLYDEIGLSPTPRLKQLITSPCSVAGESRFNDATRR